MADYFTNFSVIYEIPEQHRAWVERILSGTEEPFERVEWPSEQDTPQFGWQWDANARHGGSDRKGETSLWIYSDGQGFVEDVCTFIAYIQKRLDLVHPFSMEWANSCSKPRIDAYSGGALVIHRGKDRFINTGCWVDREMKKIALKEAKRAIKKRKK